MYTLMYLSRMPKSYSIAAARAQLAELVDQAESGKEVELTRRGKKVAVLLSAAKYARLNGNRVAFMSAFDNFCRENDMREIGVEPGWAEQLRDKTPGRSVKL
jgi:prevent-host-death family protein